MIRISQHIIVAVFLAFAGPLVSFAQTILYVTSSHGAGGNGTKARPFTSIREALTVARQTPGVVTVKLFGGTYRLKEAIVFTAADSRKKNELLTLTKFLSPSCVVSQQR